MSVAGQPAATDPLPHKKTYDEYVRIVEPGRHVFRSRLSPLGRGFNVAASFGGAIAMVGLGLRFGTDPRGGAFGIGLMCLMWAGGLAVALVSAWGALRKTVVEITRRHVIVNQRRFIRWRKDVWDLSSFTEATLEARPQFSYGGGSVQYRPRLVFFDDPALCYFNRNTWMNEPFDYKKDGDEFIQAINASVELARRAPEIF